MYFARTSLYPVLLILSVAVSFAGFELALESAHKVKRAIVREVTSTDVIDRATLDTVLEPSAPPPPQQFGPTSEFPFRSPVPVPDGFRLKIWTASASHGEDTTYRPDKVFPNLVCTVLDSLEIPSTCLNQSRAGQAINGNISNLERLAEKWRPDYVVLYQMSLDVSSLANKYHRAGRGAIDDSAERSTRRDPLSARVNAMLRRHIEETMIWRDGREFIGSVLLLNAPLPNQLPPMADAEFQAKLDRFIRAARQANATPVLSTFAVSHDVQSMDTLPFRTKTWILFWQSGLSVDGFIQTFDRYNALIRETALREGLLLVDLASEIGGNTGLFRDLVHFNEEGHRQVAKVIASTIADEQRQVRDF